MEYRKFGEYEDDISDSPKCPVCGGPGTFLGKLGERIHYKCRNCGIGFSHKEE